MPEQPPVEAILAAIRARMDGKAPPPLHDDDEAMPHVVGQHGAEAHRTEEAEAAPGTAQPAVNPADSVLAAEVRALLAPALRRWLDANLPEMVERITRAEIRRMTGHS